MNGKGDKDSRVSDRERYRSEFERIFRKQKRSIKKTHRLAPETRVTKTRQY